jgi:signal transduction histidine kinase
LILDTVFGLVFVLAGAVAWERRADVPFGPLLLAAGASWFIGSYAPTGWMPFSWLGFSFERYYDVILAFIVLTFPGVSLRGPSRWAWWALAVGFLVRTTSRLLIGCDCVENPIALFVNSELFEGLQLYPSAVIAIAAMWIAVLAASRLVGSAPASRIVLRPVAIGGIVAALVAAWDAIDLMLFLVTGAGVVRLAPPWDELVSWTIIAAIALVPLGYLSGILRIRARRGPLATLAIQLDRRPGPDDLQAALRQALGDPQAQLLVWDGRQESWIDASLERTLLPESDDGMSVTRLERDGEPYAAIVHDIALREDPSLIAATTSLLRLALDNARLADAVKDQLEQVRSSRARLVEAAASERRRIERDLHDGAQQRLIAVALSLQHARAEAAKDTPSAAFLRQLDDAGDELLAAVDELRELARGIHPAVLTEEGLRIAVASLARRTAIPVEVEVTVDGRLPVAVETTAYYVVAEALTNVSRHSGARIATVKVDRSNGHLEIKVSDDGMGGADANKGSGLRGLADRLDAVAGTLAIDSSPEGTTLKARIPCG